jgi:hypothetical protein
MLLRASICLSIIIKCDIGKFINIWQEKIYTTIFVRLCTHLDRNLWNMLRRFESCQGHQLSWRSHPPPLPCQKCPLRFSWSNISPDVKLTVLFHHVSATACTKDPGWYQTLMFLVRRYFSLHFQLCGVVASFSVVLGSITLYSLRASAPARDVHAFENMGIQCYAEIPASNYAR